jgi:ABC-type multidrug transport system ATPase subunit
MMNEPALIISGLKKTYSGGIQALKGIDLEIPAGMFGLLGPNGAGKTTLMKILATLLEPDAGSARMNGIDLIADKAATRRMLGYLPQDFGFYPSFTAEQMLDYLAKLKGISHAKERKAQVGALLERVNLASERKRKLGAYSGGMRQRFGIAQALLGHPKLLIVDEPTAGLDPEERLRFHNLLSEVADEVVVLLSTHIVSDVSHLCGQMAIICQGEIVAAGSPSEAISRMAGRVWEAALERQTAAELKPRLKVISAQMAAGLVRLRAFSDHGQPSHQFTPAAPGLEDYYFSLIHQTARENPHA